MEKAFLEKKLNLRRCILGEKWESKEYPEKGSFSRLDATTIALNATGPAQQVFIFKQEEALGVPFKKQKKGSEPFNKEDVL